MTRLIEEEQIEKSKTLRCLHVTGHHRRKVDLIDKGPATSLDLVSREAPAIATAGSHQTMAWTVALTRRPKSKDPLLSTGTQAVARNFSIQLISSPTFQDARRLRESIVRYWHRHKLFGIVSREVYYEAFGSLMREQSGYRFVGLEVR